MTPEELLTHTSEFVFFGDAQHDHRDITVRRVAAYTDEWVVRQGDPFFWGRHGDWLCEPAYKWFDAPERALVTFTRDEAVAIAEWLVSRRASASRPVGDDPSGVGDDTWAEFAAAHRIRTGVVG